MIETNRISGGLDYAPWRLPGSRLTFRGPGGPVGGRYVAVLGGLETCGRFVARPYPDLLEGRLGIRCVNFGAPHAGPDAFLADAAVLDACETAAATVIALPGAQGVRNRFYATHTRRNDRVIRHGDALRALFPEVDVAQHVFVRHLLTDLERLSPKRFAEVREELQRAWVERMRQICTRVGGEIVLLWMGGRSPDDPAVSVRDGDPTFVTRAMVDTLGDLVRGKVELVDLSREETTRLAGKVFAAGEARSAADLPQVALHRQAAEQLEAILRPVLSGQMPLAKRRTA